MKIGQDSLTNIGQLNTLNQNQKPQSPGAGSSQFGSLLASVLNQLILETETQASDQSSLDSSSSSSNLDLASLLSNNAGLTSSSSNLDLGSLLGSNVGLASTSPNLDLGSLLGSNVGLASTSPNLDLGSLLGNNAGLASLFSNIGTNTGGLDSLLESIATGNNASVPSSGTAQLNTDTSNLVALPINSNQSLNFNTISPEKLNQELDGKLQGMGQVFMQAGKLYNIDPALLAAISQHETGNGKSQAANEKNNIAGMMGANGLKSYPSVEASIMDMARNISKNYLGEGLSSISQIGAKYAPIGADNDPTGLNNNWVKGVTQYYNQLRA